MKPGVECGSANPLMGRNFTEEEDKRNGPRAAIITYGLWQGYYGGDPDSLKKIAMVDELGYPIVGVLPRDFHFEGAGDLLVPLRLEAEPRDQGHNTDMLAQLAPGITLQQAQAEMDGLLPRFREAYPNHIGPTERGVRLEPYAKYLVGDTQNTLLLLGERALWRSAGLARDQSGYQRSTEGRVGQTQRGTGTSDIFLITL